MTGLKQESMTEQLCDNNGKEISRWSETYPRES